MPSKRGNGKLRSRSYKFRLPVISLLLISVVAPLVFLAGRFTSFGRKEFSEGSANYKTDELKLNALDQVESLFPKEVIEVIKSNTYDSGPLSLNPIERKGLSASWAQNKHVSGSRENKETFQLETHIHGDEIWSSNPGILIPRREALDVHEELGTTQIEEVVKPEQKAALPLLRLEQNVTDDEMHEVPSAQITRRQLRIERKEKRVTELTQHNGVAAANLERETIERKKEIDGDILKKYSIWRQDNDDESDFLVRLMRDQVIMARVYSTLAHSQDDADLLRELNLRIKESRRVLGEANIDTDLPHSASQKVKAMGQILSKAREHLYDCKAVTKKLRAMLQSSEEQARVLNKQSTVLRQLLAKTLPKGLHCLSMLLTSEYDKLPEDHRKFSGQEKLEDASLFHYALFSDNVIAASVVVNSTVLNAKDPEKHVFHLVTDKLNYAAMKVWFLANPPGNATIQVQNIDDFKWLNSSYCPVLHQLQTATMKEYYFKASQPATLADASSNLKYRNPKYLSMLNHLRFYLPEVYPKLDKILFLDDDIVVQTDLTPLWSIDLHGNVNGAVETCGETFHRFDKYLNFSNPLISANFDSNACGWAYGMNIFDLQEWKKQDVTGIYHKWQTMNEQRELWKLGTLPPGLITFYNLTWPVDKTWHVLGLGYDPNIEPGNIQRAAVIHYNGNMKPWLELAMSKYKQYWTRYVDYDNYFLQQCNLNL